MPRVNRREIFADDEIQVFHLINRCARRTFFCGIDERAGRDFSHRKDWIRDRLEVLAGIFAIDVMGFAVLSNHMHLVARTRPDVVKTAQNGQQNGGIRTVPKSRQDFRTTRRESRSSVKAF